MTGKLSAANATGLPWAEAGSRAPNGCEMESSQLKEGVFLLPGHQTQPFLQCTLWSQFKCLCKLFL